jgi:prepilin-type N-terminal cleavage/methylation domain-containing protein
MDKSGLARRGYSLVEVLAVVVILGLLAALITIGVQWLIEDARRTAFRADMQTFTRAAEIHYLQNGAYPAPTEPGEVPPELEQMIERSRWARDSPLGGQWQIQDVPSGGVGVGVWLGDVLEEETESVLRQERAIERMRMYDEDWDDGDLATGTFRQSGSFFFTALTG